MKKIIIAVISVTIGLGLGYVLSSPEQGEIAEVHAMMESNASNSEKLIYLEKRYENEIGRLEILLSHADLCSSKYLNELSTLSLSFSATELGYNQMEEMIDYSKYPTLEEKVEDYRLLIEYYDEMYDYIKDEDYTEAIDCLDKIEEIKVKVYQDLESELTGVE